MATTKFIEVKKTARYFTYGNNENPSFLWFALHGYGQSAAHFIKKFEFMDPAVHLIIAPEGLSRFYLDGLYGRVGASWMTKEDRQNEIKDHVEYLNLLYRNVTITIHTSPKIIGFGFSQGIATLTRWLARDNCPVDYFVNWAGSFPDDVEFPDSKVLRTVKPVMLFGDEDPFINEEKINQQLKLIEPLNSSPEIFRYSGGHRVLAGPLKEVIHFITSD